MKRYNITRKYCVKLNTGGFISYLSHKGKNSYSLRTAKKYAAEIGTKYGIATIEPSAT